MNKSDLLEKVVERANPPKGCVQAIFMALFESLTQALTEGQRIEIRGFGVFASKRYRARIGRNPRTGKPVSVTGKRLPYFKVSKQLRGRVDV